MEPKKENSPARQQGRIRLVDKNGQEIHDEVMKEALFRSFIYKLLSDQEKNRARKCRTI